MHILTAKNMTAVFNGQSKIHTIESDEIHVLVMQTETGMKLEYQLKLPIINGYFKDYFSKIYPDVVCDITMLTAIGTAIDVFKSKISNMKKESLSDYKLLTEMIESVIGGDYDIRIGII